MLWFHCDDTTGAIVTGGMAPTLEQAQAQGQHAQEGLSLFVVPDGTVANMFSPDPDFAVLRDMLCRQVDTEAGALRGRFITEVPGQAQTYERKEREARSWTEGDDVAHPALYPFMLAEAAARGMSVADVRAEIMQQVDALTPIAARIEAERIACKKLIGSAPTLPRIVAAANVNWQAIVAA